MSISFLDPVSGSWVTALIFASGTQLEHEKRCSEAAAGWITIKVVASQVSFPLALPYTLFPPLSSLSFFSKQ